MHFDNPIFIFILIVAALLRWLSKRSETSGDEPERPNVPNMPPSRSNDTDSEEERIRKFLEALGQPTGSRPPPKVAPRRRRQLQPRPFATSQLPPLTTVPPSEPSFPASTVDKPPPLPVESSSAFTPAVPLPTDSARPAKRALFDPAGLNLGLESPQDLRKAIILREIFGPPRGVQSLEMF